MDWLSQNWVWLALVVGMVWMHSRGMHSGGRHGGSMGCCGGHDKAREGPAEKGEAQGADAPGSPVKEGRSEQRGERAAS